MPLRSARALSVPLSVATLALAGCTDVLDRSSDGELVALSSNTPAPETDEAPTHEVALRAPGGALVPIGKARTARMHPAGGSLLVDEDARLMLVNKKGVARPLLDSVEGEPAVLPDGRVVASRATDIGESNLWIVPLDGEPPTALTSTTAGNGQPFVLDDGRVLFVSDRTGVVGLYIVDPATLEVTQLTNAGERPGALSESFVPTPLRDLRQEGSRVIYDAGDGVWAVDIHSGEAQEVK